MSIMANLVLFAALDGGWVVLVLNERVHAPGLWNLQGGIKLKVWDWVHRVLGSFLCNISDTDIFICNLGRTGNI